MIDLFAKPLGLLLKFVYDTSVSIGLDFKYLSAYAVAIIVATIIFKLLLLPLNIKQAKSMKNLQVVQPKLQELQKKYKNDPQTLNEKTLELYKQYNVNPLGGCLPLLIQFPILIAYFRVMQQPVKYVFGNQALFDQINKAFLWIKDIALQPTAIVNGVSNDLQIAGITIPIIAILSALTTYLSSKMMSAQNQQGSSGQNQQAQATQKTMTIVMPIMFLVFGYTYPVGFTLYWTVSNIFQIVQQYFTNKTIVNLKGESS
ncbi:inner membrane protein translocase component YidC [Gottschalkia purinilytica]|uniref:Inner membrane protein translocase component YidC n=1 Tax=Gottschalkia purinilytica TaxID=1503 RepID=A0A0L0W703_GOTPU|nr:YidC/Oxa1 family membrane protein insertase [Gottschalkia purinilytica]KNF07294.1 inner membrane protein translocase component YidC [Gottschalkia purinilytica]